MFDLVTRQTIFFSNLAPFLPALLLSFIVSFILTILVIRLAERFGFMDDPKRLHPAILHKKPLPRAGGVPMFLAFVVVTLIFVKIDLKIVGIILASFLTVIVGTIDDKWPLSPYLRLFLTQPLAALVVILFGINIPGGTITNPFGGYLIIPPFLGAVLLVLWVIWVMNMVNWSKGVSQLSGVSFISFIVLGLVALSYKAGNPEQLRTAMLAFILAGAVLAFLPFNFPPEKILPGFGASTFIGLNLAILSILSGGKLAAAIVVLGLPAVDMLIAIIRRLKNGKNPLFGDREHLYHKLLDIGFSKRTVIFIYWLITLFLGILAINLKSSGKFFVLLVLSILVVSIFVWINLILGKVRRQGEG